MTETPPMMTPTPAPAPSSSILSPITPDPVGTPDKGIAGYIRGCFQPYVNFDGRARRKEYGLYVAFYFLVIAVLFVLRGVITAMTAGPDGESMIGFLFGFLPVIFGLACFIPYCGVSVRRVHDMGLPFWVAIIAVFFSIFGLFIFWVPILVLLLVPSQDGANIYGPYPKPRV